jgi:hypothetical protein
MEVDMRTLLLLASVLVASTACGSASPSGPSDTPTPAPNPTPVAIWTASGSGDMVLDMPTHIRRVRIQAAYGGSTSNFMVYIAGDLKVNEILGTSWDRTTYDGTILTSGGVVQITHAAGVSWAFTEVR